MPLRRVQTTRRFNFLFFLCITVMDYASRSAKFVIIYEAVLSIMSFSSKKKKKREEKNLLSLNFDVPFN